MNSEMTEEEVEALTQAVVPEGTSDQVLVRTIEVLELSVVFDEMCDLIVDAAKHARAGTKCETPDDVVVQALAAVFALLRLKAGTNATELFEVMDAQTALGIFGVDPQLEADHPEVDFGGVVGVGFTTTEADGEVVGAPGFVVWIGENHEAVCLCGDQS